MKYSLGETIDSKKRLFTAITAPMTIWLCFWSWQILAPTMHWPMSSDNSGMEYMGWLANHGMRLFTDVVDVQFPGSIMVYSAVRIVFGKTDFGFRMFDLVGLGSMLLSMFAFSRYDGKWFAAVFGFAYRLWVHTGIYSSIADLGQRDFIIAALMLAGTVGAEGSGQRRMKWMAVFGALVGLAVTMKPNAALFFFLPLPCFRAWLSGKALAGSVALVLHRVCCRNSGGPQLFVETPCACCIFVTTTRVLPMYYGIRQMSYGDMFVLLNYPSRILPLAALTCTAALILDPEIRGKTIQQVLLTGTFSGAVSYFSQHKGAYYQREPFYAFFFCGSAGF